MAAQFLFWEYFFEFWVLCLCAVHAVEESSQDMTWLLVENVLVIEDGVGRLQKGRRQPAHPRLKHELPGPVRPSDNKNDGKFSSIAFTNYFTKVTGSGGVVSTPAFSRFLQVA